jgi:nucleotide-binding universal stress UspA family protein
MMQYRKILVPYDGSRQSDKALQHALDIAKHIKGSKLTILHVIQDIPRPPYFQYEPEGATGKTSAQHLKEIYYGMKAGAEKMLARKKDACVRSGVETITKVALGRVSDVVIEHIKANKIELVVLGTTGLGGISKIKALGSVARNIAEKAGCPVLLVH